MDPNIGNPSFSPSFTAVEEAIMLEGLMNILERYSRKRKLVVAFDEFQEVADMLKTDLKKDRDPLFRDMRIYVTSFPGADNI